MESCLCELFPVPGSFLSSSFLPLDCQKGADLLYYAILPNVLTYHGSEARRENDNRMENS